MNVKGKSLDGRDVPGFLGVDSKTPFIAAVSGRLALMRCRQDFPGLGLLPQSSMLILATTLNVFLAGSAFAQDIPHRGGLRSGQHFESTQIEDSQDQEARALLSS